MTVKDRIRHHRANLRQQHFCRLDVWIHQSTISEIRRMATARELAVWSVVEAALKSYMTEYGALIAERKGLLEKRSCLQPFVSALGYQDMIRDYEQQVVAWKKRRDRFLTPSSHPIEAE